MRFDRCAVQRQRHAILTCLRQSIEDRRPAFTLGPTIEAIVDRGVGTVFTRAVAPPRPRLEHVHDAADNTPVVSALGARQIGRQMRLDARPLPVVSTK